MFLSLSFFFLLLISSSTACDRCLHQTKAAYFADESALHSGACSYGSLALSFNGGNVAAAVPNIYKQGAGCGACFQMRCKNIKLCSKQGTKLIVTDLNTHNETDFVLSSKAFSAMAQQGKEQEVLKLGITDVEYRRIPCDYKNKNLSIRVEESSKKPYYLSVKLFYQGGQTEIVGIDVAQVGSSNWNFLNRSHGAVWDTSRIPTGPLQFRFVVTAGFDGKYYWAKAVLPQDWKNGVIYDTGLQITDIAQEACSPCDTSDWN